MEDRRHLEGMAIQAKRKSNVKMLTGGVFRVASASKVGVRYVVKLNTVPQKCGCEDWRKRRRHCKHIYAVIERLRSTGTSRYDVVKHMVPELRNDVKPRESIVIKVPPWVADPAGHPGTVTDKLDRDPA